MEAKAERAVAGIKPPQDGVPQLILPPSGQPIRIDKPVEGSGENLLQHLSANSIS